MHQQAQHGSTVAFARASARSDRQLKIHAGRDASAHLVAPRDAACSPGKLMDRLDPGLLLQVAGGPLPD
jgi:hypothetical protein